MNKMSNKNGSSAKERKLIEETLIQVGLRIAKRGEGALFIFGDVEHDLLVDQTVFPFKVSDNPKLLESLALMDGAVIIDKNGVMKAYGAKIKSDRTFKNFGTRHSAGMSAAIGDNTVVVVSEEDKKLRIFKKGKMIMQIDALQKGIEKSVDGAVGVLESIGVGTIGTIGTTLLVPTLGVYFLPGIVVFGSTYYLGKILQKKITG